MDFIHPLSELPLLLEWEPDTPFYSQIRKPWVGGVIRDITKEDRKIRSFLTDSKLEQTFQSIPGLVVLNPDFGNPLSLPVYYNGKRYDCYIGSWNSYEACKIMKLDHPIIPKNIQIVANGRVHYLIEPSRWIYRAYTAEDLPDDEDLKKQMLEQTADFSVFAAAQGFNPNCFGTFGALFVADGNKLMFIANERSVRVRPGEWMNIPSRPDESSTSNTQWDAVNTNPTVLSTSRDAVERVKFEKSEYKAVVKDLLKKLYLVGYGRVDYQPKTPFAEYTLPPVDPNRVSVEILKEWRNVIDYEQDRFNWLEVLMAIASKFPNDLFTLAPGGRTLELLSKIFLERLSEFGYVREPLYFYLEDFEEIKEMEKFFFGDVQNLYHYQTVYNNARVRNINKTRRGDPWDPKSTKPFTSYSYKLFLSVPDKIDSIYMRSWKDYPHAKPLTWYSTEDVNQVKAETEDEQKRWADLEVESVDVGSVIIKLNGREFNTYDLSRIFFNTPITQVLQRVNPGEDVPISWLTQEDIQLIQKVIKGELMFWSMYAGLSLNAYNNLSYKGSLLDLFEYPPFRLRMNFIFVVGKPLVEQIKDGIKELEKVSIFEKLRHLYT